MAATGTATKKTTQAKATSRPEDRNVAETAVAYVRQTAERAVDVPVGAALTVADNVSESVKPWTESTARERELKQLRAQVTRELNKLERRGGQARRKATTRVRGTRNRLERELKQRRNSVERAVRQNRAKAERELKTRRTRVETAVKDNRAKAEKALSDVRTAVEERVGSTNASA